MAKAITESTPAGKDQEKVVNIIISVVSIMRICSCIGYMLIHFSCLTRTMSQNKLHVSTIYPIFNEGRGKHLLTKNDPLQLIDIGKNGKVQMG